MEETKRCVSWYRWSDVGGCCRTKQLIDLRSNTIQLLLQYLITFDGIASDLLIDVGRHAREVRDVRLESWFAIANRFVDELSFNACESFVFALRFTHASYQLVDAADEFAHAHVVIELFLQVSLRHAVGRHTRIDQNIKRLRQYGGGHFESRLVVTRRQRYACAVSYVPDKPIHAGHFCNSRRRCETSRRRRVGIDLCFRATTARTAATAWRRRVAVVGVEHGSFRIEDLDHDRFRRNRRQVVIDR